MEGGSTNKELNYEDEFDVFAILHWFLKKPHDGVRDFLVNKLYECKDSEIDFIIPQLCHLFMVWPNSQNASMGRYLTYKCSTSIHLALKIIFNLQANVHYGTPEQSQRCQTLVEDCEMALVNAKVTIGTQSQEKEREAWVKAKTERKEQQPLPKLEENGKPTSPQAGSRAAEAPGASNSAPKISPKSPTTTVTTATADVSPITTSTSTATSTVPDTTNTENCTTTAATTTTNSSNANSKDRPPVANSQPPLTVEPQSPSKSLMKQRRKSARELRQEEAEKQTDFELDPQEVEILQTKHIRSEYFNQELKLMADLDEMSETLVKVPRKHGKRKKMLQELVKKMNSSIIGLYFPSNESSDAHYKTLRIPPEECVPLSSRDKAPFLMYLEIAYTNKSVYDEDTFMCYHDFVHSNLHGTPWSPGKMAKKAPTSPVSVSSSSSSDSSSQPDPSSDSVEQCSSPVKDPMFYKRRNSVKNSTVLFPSSEVTQGQDSQVTREKTSAVEPSKDQDRSATEKKERKHRSKRGSVKAAYPKEHVKMAFGEDWNQKKRRLRALSRHGVSEANWDLKSVIFKGGDDCRQEVLAMQLIQLFNKTWKEAKLPLKLRPYSVMVTSAKSGLIETIPNSVSIDSLKKSHTGFVSLAKFFEDFFGPKGSPGHTNAQRNFVESMAAYSIVSYFLQVKDRHNGNIMLDSEGHIIHIDFGFMLSNSPGGNINFESCPFKLTQEFIEVMEGEGSQSYNYFTILICRAYYHARACADKILLLVESMMVGSVGKNMDCFLGGPNTLVALRDRFMLDGSESECVEHAVGLLRESICNWRTVQYDKYQTIVNDIL